MWNELFDFVPAGVQLTCLLDCGPLCCTVDAFAQRGLVSGTDKNSSALLEFSNTLKSQRAQCANEYTSRAALFPASLFTTHDVLHDSSLSTITYHTLFHPFAGGVSTSSSSSSSENYGGASLLNVIRGCRKGQLCHDAFIETTTGGRYHGVFSWAMIEVLKAYDNVTPSDIVELTTAFIHSIGYPQNPQLFISHMDNMHLQFL
jgi:hypothetical protein